MGASVAAYEVSAFNTAAASDNKIHDDAVAQRFGFRGGLVPGVEVYAYMMHLPVGRWGRQWLESGIAECRFLKPVYDGALARVTASEENGGLALSVDSGGERCAVGYAGVVAGQDLAPAVDAIPNAVPPPFAERPPASEESLAVGRVLGIAPQTIDARALGDYLEAVRETAPIYRAEGLVHPGQILRLANQALVQNVVLGPWIHVGSTLRHHRAARLGEELTLRARVTSNTVSKGHAIVEFEAVVVADASRTVAALTHTAIWRPRQVAQAA
jgi:acyl dehydratase